MAPEKNTMVLVTGRRWGKALAVDTPILTMDGWKTMATVAVGDVVFDEQGRPTRVISTSPVYFGHLCYEVVFDDGATIVADAEHLWYAETKQFRKNMPRRTNTRWPGGRVAIKTVWTTEEIAGSLRYRDYESEYSIPVCGPIQFPECDLPIDPYILGLWLGDGSSYYAAITTSDDELLQAIRQAGYEVHKYSGQYAYGITRGGPRRSENGRDFAANPDTLSNKLRALGLFSNKHIPDIYLRAAPSQRLDLLQGLMDTDGYISDTGHCEFTSVNERLALDVLALALSLGIKASLYKADATLNGRRVSAKYRVRFTPPGHVPVFRLERKARRQRSKVAPWVARRYIREVRPVESVPVRCIAVDSPGHLYCAGSHLIPTHNSEVAAVQALYYAVMRPSFRQGIVSVTLDQARLAFDVALSFAQDNPVISRLIAKVRETPFPLIHFVNGSEITVRTSARDGIYLRGHKFHRLILDEADYLSERFVNEVARMTLADYNGQLVLISTPRSRRSIVYTELQNGLAGKPGVYAQTGATFENPNISHEYIASLKERLTQAAWLREVEGQYADDDSAVFRWEDIQAAYEDADWRLGEKRDKAAYVIGADLAKSMDWTVITVLDITQKPYRVVAFDRFQRQPWPVVVERLRQAHTEYQPVRMLIDATGVGGAVLDEVRDIAQGFVFTARTKVDLITNLQLALEKRFVKLPFIRELVDELQNYEWDDTKLETDCVMSLALALWAAGREIGVEYAPSIWR